MSHPTHGTPRSIRRAALSAAAATLLYLAVGCGNGLPGKVKYAAPPTSVLLGNVSVNFNRADASDDEMFVKMYFTNLSDQVLIVNRDLIGLRLPDGRVLQRRGSNHSPYFIPPGQGHEVWVKFEEPGLDLRTVQVAALVIGGVSWVSDPAPRVVGEIPLNWAGASD